MTRLSVTAGQELVSPHNLAPSLFLGVWWMPLGLALAALFTLRGRLALARLSAAPYWFGY